MPVQRKRKRKLSYRKIKTIIAAVALIAVGYMAFKHGRQVIKEKEEAEAIQPHLNDSVTNAMSSYPGTEKMDEIIEKYLKRWEVNGAQLAVSRNDSLVYAKGYGWAEKEKNQRMEPSNIMRIASVSKLLTAVGIMKLQEMGKVRLSDHVFGPQGILNDTLYTNAIQDKKYLDITVEQLLRHQAGFTNYAGDPMFSTRYIMMQNHLNTPPTNPELLRIVLKKRHLSYQPGQGQKYCNIGYMLLSLIIEKRSGMNYEAFMQKYVLQPAGCYDFHIAGNYYKDRHPREVKYYMHKEAEPIEEFNNSGRMVVKCYGENNIPHLLGAGAWCASAAELCHFISAIDGDPHYPDILSAKSIQSMTEEMPDHKFSLGWNFTPKNGPWIRTGTLSGTSALVMKFPDNQCWVFITNTSTWKGQGFAKDTKELFEKLRKEFGNSLRPLPIHYPKS